MATMRSALVRSERAQAPRHLVAVHARACRCRAARCPGGTRRRPRAPARPSWATRVSWPSDLQQHARASRRRRRCRRRPGCAAAAAAWPSRPPWPSRAARGRLGRQRQPDDELAALALALALRLERAAVQLDDAAARARGRCPGRRRRARSGVRPCTNMSKMRADAASGSMPRPVSRTRSTACRLRARLHRDAAAFGRVARGVVEQVGEHLRQAGAASPSRRCGSRGRSTSTRVAARLDRRRGGLDRAAHDARRCRRGARSSASAPRVMREMSSMSSTMRASCALCRSIVSRICSLRRVGRPAACAITCTAVRIGASGLRSSCASMAMNSFTFCAAFSSVLDVAPLGQVLRDLGEAAQVARRRRSSGGDHGARPEARRRPCARASLRFRRGPRAARRASSSQGLPACDVLGRCRSARSACR